MELCDLQSRRLLSRWARIMKNPNERERITQFIALKSEIDRHVALNQLVYDDADFASSALRLTGSDASR